MDNLQTFFTIEYKSRLDGLKHRYMQCGFNTHREALNELRKIKKEAEKNHYSTKRLREMSSANLQTYMIGTDWRIVPLTYSHR